MSNDLQGSGGPSNLLAKMIGGLFALIVAPVLVTVGSNMLQKKLDLDANDAPQKTVAAAPVTAGPTKPDKPAEKQPKDDRSREKPSDTSPTAPEPKKPRELRPTAPEPRTQTAKVQDARPAAPENAKPETRIAHRLFEKKKLLVLNHLFDGKDLSHFNTFLGTPPKSERLRPYGKNSDPEKVFAVHNGQLHVSGKVPGLLETDQDYENYHLTVEYAFGARTWPPRENGPKLSGILIHAREAQEGDLAHWRNGFRVLISQDSVGGIAFPQAPDHGLSLTIEAEKAALPKEKKVGRGRFHYKPGAAPVTLTRGVVDRLGFTFTKGQGQAQEETKPVIKPRDDWNTLECICAGDKLTVLLNHKVVNVATSLSRSRGRIAIISDGAEILFRKVDLKTLPLPLSKSGL
jgi:hypothetical protein